jgi:hypothetical protein
VVLEEGRFPLHYQWENLWYRTDSKEFRISIGPRQSCAHRQHEFRQSYKGGSTIVHIKSRRRMQPRYYTEGDNSKLQHYSVHKLLLGPPVILYSHTAIRYQSRSYYDYHEGLHAFILLLRTPTSMLRWVTSSSRGLFTLSTRREYTCTLMKTPCT